MASTHVSTTGIIQTRQNDASSKMKLTICHQLSGIQLVSPVYVGYGTCYLPPDQRVDVGFTTQVGFDINPDQGLGILMYKLERKNMDEFDEVTCVQIVIVWRVCTSGEFCIVSDLIEHDKDSIWDRDRLIRLANCYTLFNMQRGPIEETYLMNDNTVLMTRVNATREGGCYKLVMTISETSIRDDTQRPRYMDVDR
jgi:hypothetical protein